MAAKGDGTQAGGQKPRTAGPARSGAQDELMQKLQVSENLAELLIRASELRNLVGADWVFAWAFVDGVLVTQDPAGGEVRVPVEAAGIPGYVAKTGQVVNIADVYNEAELRRINPKLTFNRSADEASGYRTKQVLCVPVLYKGSVVGVLQSINKLGSEKFDFMDVESLSDVARSLGPLMHQAVELDRRDRKLRRQEHLNRLVNAIHAAKDINQILISLTLEMAGLFDAERVTVYAVDAETGELFSRAKLGDDIREYRVPINSSSIAGYVAMSRTSVSITDVYDEKELARIHPELSFNRSFDEKTGFRTREVLAAPIEFQGELLGVLQLINSLDGRPFDEPDLSAAKALAETLGIAFHNQARAGIKKTRFEALLDKKLVTREQLDAAREKAKEEGVSVESILMSTYKVPKKALLEAYGEFYGTGVFEFDPRMTFPQEPLKALSDRYEELKHGCFVPIEENGGKLVVAIDDPRDVVKRDRVQALFPERRVEYRVAIAEDIAAAVDLFFGAGGTSESVSELLSKLEESAEAAPHVEGEEEEEEASEDDSAVVKLVNRIIEDAYRRGASDIHIEPSPDGEALVRYRIDGSLQKAMTFPKAYRNAILSRIKIMSDLDIAERRKPQSGKIKFKKWGKLDIELRVECVPTAGGTEDAVLRILAASKPLPLSALNMSERNLREFTRLIEQPYGLILCVGPTGSGKTTTLHSALGHINREDVKIWTAEDPVEITQKGLRQVQVNRKAGLDFAAAMRSFLRADPDVIMIGEMRDQETAEIGIEASLTGHLVLSTLHTNSAPETVVRLLDMGIDPYSFADALLGVLAQRLVRTLCKDCKEEYKLTAEDVAQLRAEYGADTLFDALKVEPGRQIFRARVGGCQKCGKTGYRGRTGIHELLVCTDEIRTLIYKRAKAMDIRDVAIAQGMRTLKQDGIEKVLKGETTLEEVRSVCSR